MMACRSIVGIYFLQALLGRNTPNKLLMRHTNWFGIETNEAEFPSTFFVHQPWAISKHQSQPGPPSNLASTFPKLPRPSKIPSTFSKLPTQPLFQAPMPAQPTRQPRMQPHKHFSQAPPPIKISKHFSQAPQLARFPSTNPSPAHRASLHATSQALFPSFPVFQAPPVFQAVRRTKCLRTFFLPLCFSSPRLQLHLAFYNQHSKKFLYCQGTKIFHAEGICDMCPPHGERVPQPHRHEQ